MRRVKHPNVKAVTSRGKTYYYYDTGGKKNGKPVLFRLPDPSSPQFGHALSQATAARNRRKDMDTVLTVPELIRRYERSPAYARLSAGSQRIYSLYLAKLGKAFNTYPADGLTRKEIGDLADSLVSTPAASNMIVRITGALYKWGRLRLDLTARPCDDIELYDGGSHEPWPAELLEEALAEKDERIRVPVALMYYTALRIGDVCKLNWNNLSGDRVVVVPQKTQKSMPDGLDFPVHRDLATALANVPKRGTRIVAKENGTPYASLTVRRYIQAWAKERGHDIVPHGLRKNAVNSLLEAGNSVPQTASISGQSLAVVEMYARKRSQATLGSAAILRWEGKAK